MINDWLFPQLQLDGNNFVFRQDCTTLPPGRLRTLHVFVLDCGLRFFYIYIFLKFFFPIFEVRKIHRLGTLPSAKPGCEPKCRISDVQLTIRLVKLALFYHDLCNDAIRFVWNRTNHFGTPCICIYIYYTYTNIIKRGHYFSSSDFNV